MGLEPAAAQSLAGCAFRRRLVYYRLLPGWTRTFGAGKYTQVMYHEKPSEPCGFNTTDWYVVTPHLTYDDRTCTCYNCSSAHHQGALLLPMLLFVSRRL